MSSASRRGLALVALWVAVVVGGLATRPAWPIDETRYLAVAWEMWARGDFLVPYLNGSPYGDKPPLLFWLIGAGWRLFGVQEWWARLVPSLFALASLFLTARLARRLWPDRPEVAAAAPLLLVATLLWSFYTTVLLFDMMLVFFTLAGILGLVRASRGERAGWLLYALATGFGILSKGPAIFLWLVPAAAAAPWWSGRPETRPRRWYPRVLAAIAGGAALAFAWAIPAALSGGPAYADQILWSQTAGRVTTAFAHRQPLWWYVPFAPLLVFPWVLWPAIWRRPPGSARLAGDPGLRLCAVWTIGGFAAFSLVSGKQIHYLLPLLPPLALAGARALTASDEPVRRRGLAGVAASLFLLAAVFAGARWLSTAVDLPSWVADISPMTGALVAVCALVLLFVRPRSRLASLQVVAACSVAALVVMLAAAGRSAAPRYDVSAVARYLGPLEREGRPLAHVGKYRGEYHFAGRLTRPLEVITEDQVAAWFSRNPGGYVVVNSNRRLLAQPEDAFRHDYRGGVVVVRREAPDPGKRSPARR
jgi:4-amino-4-deoxy-L-arabinose transferase-like glycosyltransferase